MVSLDLSWLKDHWDWHGFDFRFSYYLSGKISCEWTANVIIGLCILSLVIYVMTFLPAGSMNMPCDSKGNYHKETTWQWLAIETKMMWKNLIWSYVVNVAPAYNIIYLFYIFYETEERQTNHNIVSIYL